MNNLLVLVPPFFTTVGVAILVYVVLVRGLEFYQRGLRPRLKRSIWLTTRAPSMVDQRVLDEYEIYGVSQNITTWIVGSALGGLLLALVAGAGPFSLLGLLAGLLPLLWRQRKLSQARFDARQQVGYLIEDVQLTLGFSSTLGAALLAITERADPAEIVGARLLANRDRLQLDGPEALLERLAAELRSREVRLLLARVRAVRLGGGETQAALRAAAADVSAEIARQVEAEIEGAPLRLVFPMLALLLPPLLAVLLYPPASLLIEALTGAGPTGLSGLK